MTADPKTLTARRWDAVVIGTGMGGATIGHALATGGMRVLFLEAGRADPSDGGAYRGRYAELWFARAEAPHAGHREPLSRAGRYVDPVVDATTPRNRTFIPFIGAGAGGSTALYGMALERFFPADFAPRQFYPEAAGSSLPDAWPVDYNELAPWYAEAESLFRVRGTLDPLRGTEPDAPRLLAPPPTSPANEALARRLASKGLSPYRLPSACEFVPGCRGCQGYLCPFPCKNDAARICLTPAVERHGAVVLDRCHVERLSAEGRRVTEIVAERDGERLTFTGERVILAAGALNSPAILLRSRSADWPHGLANDSGLVGRNLMRHLIDLYALKVAPEPKPDTNVKEIAFNDFYLRDGRKLGSVQSFGELPPPSVIVAAMADELRDGRLPLLGSLVRAAAPVLQRAIAGKLRGRIILASLLEDLPYPENRIEVPADGTSRTIRLHYRLAPHEKRRIAEFRRLLRPLLAEFSPVLLKQAENNERIAHACGTCRFGDDPASSVLDRWNRAHALDNLYVVDSSFFPSSAGTNPSLTVAANALRVAHHLLGTRS